MKIVIRAGGNGTRLWPMSRTNNPKQFQKIAGEKSMLRTTYDRIRPAVASDDDIFVSVNIKMKKKIKEELSELPEKNTIIETDTRNTGPAMCLEVCFLEKFCKPEDVIASLPSDDFISDSVAFRELLKTTEEFILKNPDYILTPAVKPDYPDTGYSYLKAGTNLQTTGEEAIFKVSDWVEKPNDEYCEELLKSGIYYCHTGMYLWQLKNISDLFKKYQPKMYEVCTEIIDVMLHKKDFKQAEELYSQLEKMTIESAITDRVDKIAMSVSNKVGWSDLGKWHIIKRILTDEKKDNLTKGEVHLLRARNNLIYSTEPKKIIAVNDIHDLVIVDTGDVLFVSSLKNSADVKKIVEKLKEAGKDKYL